MKLTVLLMLFVLMMPAIAAAGNNTFHGESAESDEAGGSPPAMTVEKMPVTSPFSVSNSGAPAGMPSIEGSSTIMGSGLRDYAAGPDETGPEK